ncbi:MAG: Crp/Fnr family transcriptional regulator [Myxococcales bacterium]
MLYSLVPDMDPTETTPWTELPLLKRCSPDTRARILEQSRLDETPPFTLVIQAGKPADAVWLVSEGVVRVFHQQEDGAQFTVKLLRGPDTFGQPEVIQGTAWAASVQALTPLRALMIPREAFLDALATDHGFCRAVLDDVNNKFFGTMLASRSLGFEGCKARLARVLLEYVEQFGREKDGRVVIRHPLTRERLASEIGAARRSVDRALQTFTLERVLGHEKGWLVVEKVDALRECLKPGQLE